MREFIDYWLPLIAFLGISLGVVLFGVNFWQEYACGKYAEVTGRETKWVFMHECYINTGADWLKKNEYVAVLVAREGLQSR